MRDPFTARMWRMSNDLYSPPKILLNPALTGAGVTLINPQMPDARKLFVSPVKEERHGCAILNIGRVHLGTQYEAARVDQEVTLPAVDTFGAVVPTDAADASRPDGLAIDDPRARLGVPPDVGAELLPEDSVQLLPGAIQAPEPEIVIGGLPRWELVWEEAPGTATSDNIEDGIQYLADRVQARSPDALGWRQERVQASELGVRQVAQIRSPRGQTPAILPGKPTQVPVFRQFLARRGACRNS
jgi:hypothetical protein